MATYFDPARRVPQFPVMGRQEVPPAVVKAVDPAHGYFDPEKPRAVLSKYPTRQEIGNYAASLDIAAVRNMEALKAPGETVEGFLWRRFAFMLRCECGAFGLGEFGHRSHCREFRVWRWWFDRPGWKRRVKASLELDDPDDDFPF